MERETKEIITPISKQSIKIKTYLTGRERRALTNIYIESGVEIDSETQNVKGIKPEVIDKAQDLGWKTVIVSIDDTTDNIVDRILDMRSEDFEFVAKAVNEITANKSFEEKKTI